MKTATEVQEIQDELDSLDLSIRLTEWQSPDGYRLTELLQRLIDIVRKLQ